MDELYSFCKHINDIIESKGTLEINDARKVVKEINDFLYTNYDGIGSTYALGSKYEYLSDFHKYWESHYKEILDCQVDDTKCGQVADALHDIYKLDSKAFASVSESYRESGLSDEEICRIRLLTANQDFRGSRDFNNFAKIYKIDHSTFYEEFISKEPAEFLRRLNLGHLSQTDKRVKYAKSIADFVISYADSPYNLIKAFDNNIYDLRNALINCQSAGYGAKKADMMLRDMVVLGIWKNVSGFEKIDVASDINTIKVALRTGIISTAIPLVTSFLDIFCYQYSYIDEMNAKAWRRVWEIWNKKYPSEIILSPCLIDFFVYDVIGKQFCKKNLYLYECDTEKHTFYWHSGRNHTCQECLSNGIIGSKAHIIGRIMSCENKKEGHIAIDNTDFVEHLPSKKKIHNCPFVDICDNKKLQPPVSISIAGRTGWISAYTRKNNGGGGIMA